MEKIKFVFCSVLIFFLGCASTPAQMISLSIKSFDLLHIGMTEAEVYKTLGEPYQRFETHFSPAKDGWVYWSQTHQSGLSIVLSFDETSRLISKSYETSKSDEIKNLADVTEHYQVSDFKKQETVDRCPGHTHTQPDDIFQSSKTGIVVVVEPQEKHVTDIIFANDAWNKVSKMISDQHDQLSCPSYKPLADIHPASNE